MSIGNIASQNPIWNNAASALTNTPQPNAAGPVKPNQADNPHGKPKAIQVAGSNLLDSLSQTSQSALIQMQAQMSQTAHSS
jgi:hypothetical protein